MIYDSLVGQRLDDYRLEELLGQGGMAQVYRALDVRLKRWVAIKVIDKPFRADQNYTQRFEQEAQAIAQLEHPHIVRLYRYDEANGLLYIVLQYIEGLSLDQILATYRLDDAYIEPEEASRIIREICSALDYAHSKGVIHRDVKPSNIILNKQGNAILVDFGLALLTDAGGRNEAFGTPQYMAPEQVRSSTKVVPQSDLYAIGIILYEMFTGRVPFEMEDPLEIIKLHLTEPPPPLREFRPDLNTALEGVILKALAKDPKKRYPSGLALANALDRALKIASARKSPSLSPPPTLSHLSIPERVAAGLSEHPLPQLLAAGPVLPPELVATKPAFRVRPQANRNGGAGYQTEVRREVAAMPAPTSTGKPESLYINLGLGLGIIIGLAVAAILLMQILQRPDNIPASPVKNSPPVELPSLPPPIPPAPQLMADTHQDFADTPEGAWEYLRSDADENEFKDLEFKERRYGACWYAEDYVRICRDSGHPGANTDVAWRWTSDFNGNISVLVSAHKIDLGGDGVVIMAYHNSKPVQSLQIGPQDAQGVHDYPLFAANVKVGDQVIFVLKKNGQVEYDHIAFQAKIYRR